MQLMMLKLLLLRLPMPLLPLLLSRPLLLLLLRPLLRPQPLPQLLHLALELGRRGGGVGAAGLCGGGGQGDALVLRVPATEAGRR